MLLRLKHKNNNKYRFNHAADRFQTMEVIDMNIEYDLARICRCCRQESPDLQSIFLATACDGIDDTTLYEMLTSCTQAQVNYNDGMPSHLCEECVAEVTTAYGFRKRYEQSDVLLREYLSRRKVEPGVKVELFDVKPDIGYGCEQPDPLVGQEQQQQELIVVETISKVGEFEDDGEDELMTVEFVDESGEEEEEVDYEVGSLDEMIEELEELKPQPRGRKSNGYSKIKGEGFGCDSCERVFADRRGITNHVKQHKRKEVKQCPLCSREFTSSYHLNRHIKMHENDTDCGICGKKFGLYHDYKDHMAVEHPGVALVEQKKTERSERELALTLTAELLEDPGRMEAICRICDATFERIAQLRRHLRTHEDAKSFENVNIANKPYLFEEGYVLENYLEYLVGQVCKGNLLRFYQIVEPDGEELELSDSDSDEEDEEVVRREHTCGLCQQTFPRIKLLREHAKSCHRPEELIGCKHCARGFPNTTLFMRHLRQQCENTTKKFHCTFCNEKFMWQTSLNKHAQHKHKPTKPLWERPGEESGTSAVNEECAKKFVCQVCSKGFQRLEHLERHIKIHIPSEKKFECPVCHKKFNRKDNLRSHVKIHQKDPDADADPANKQNQLCVYCGRGFSNSSNLIVHMRRHTGERPYRCDICDKGFPRSSDLQCHRRTHTGEKPCLCTICGKGFSRSNKLVRHMRIHTGARPYSCSYCDRAFTQSNDLTLHIRRHTGEKPYVCGVCNERFIQGTALKAHQRATGHYDDGTNQPERFASISVNNPNRMGVNGPKAVRQSADGTKPVKAVKSRKKAVAAKPPATAAAITEEPPNLTPVEVAPPPQQPTGYVPTVPSYIMQNYDLTAGGLFSQSFSQQ